VPAAYLARWQVKEKYPAVFAQLPEGRPASTDEHKEPDALRWGAFALSGPLA
jgi:hypothetical protein